MKEEIKIKTIKYIKLSSDQYLKHVKHSTVGRREKTQEL